MVCLGNICRSPLAEGILKHKIKENGLDWTVDSAGTGGWHSGELPDRRSIKMAQQYGIDLTDQRARQIKPLDFDRFDLILAMDKSNFSDLKALAKTAEQKQKIHLIMNFSRPNSEEEVPDPYYDNRFQLVYNLLDEACEMLIHYHIKLDIRQ